MAQLDNPAGRLAAIFEDYTSKADGSKTVEQTWRSVLDCSETDLPIELARVCSVLTDLAKSLTALADEDSADAFNHWRYHWANAIIRPSDQMRSLPSTASDIDRGSLLSLRQISSHLHWQASEGATGTPEQRQGLRDRIQAAIDELLADSSLPDDIRRLTHERLLDILYAIDQFRITGPAGVVKATERLAGSCTVLNEQERKRWFHHLSVGNALKAAGAAWAFFVLGTDAAEALEGWKDVLAALPPGASGE